MFLMIIIGESVKVEIFVAFLSIFYNDLNKIRKCGYLGGGSVSYNGILLSNVNLLYSDNCAVHKSRVPEVWCR